MSQTPHLPLCLSFSPFPVLETKRLLLRQPEAGDDRDLFALRSNEQVNEYLEGPGARTLEEVQQFIRKINAGIMNNEWVFWVVSLKGSLELAGTICLWNINRDEAKAEIGYALLPYYQRQGLMQEAVTEVLHFGFEQTGFHTIQAYTHAENTASLKLLERNRFERMDVKGKEVIYSLKGKA